MLDSLLATLPLVLAAIVPPIVTGLRATVAGSIPSKWLPIAIPLAAAVVAGVANFFGLPLDLSTSELEGASASVWESTLAGLLIGLGSLGVHRISRQVKGEEA